MPNDRDEEYRQLENWFREEAKNFRDGTGQEIIDALDHGTPGGTFILLDHLRKTRRLPASWESRIEAYYYAVF